MSLLLLLSAGAPAALTLTCEGASVLLDGNDVNLNRGRVISADNRSFSITPSQQSFISIADTQEIIINPPAGWGLHVITDLSQASDPSCIYYGVSPSIGDQILYRTTTETNAWTVTVSSTGIVSTSGSGTDTLKFRRWTPSVWSVELTYNVISARILTADIQTYALVRNDANLLKNSYSVSGGSVYRIKTEIDGAALFTDTITQANGTILGDTAEWDRWNTTTVDTINSNGTNAVSTNANRASVGVIVANTSFGPDQWAEHTHASNSGGRFTSGPLVRASSGTTTNGYSFLNDGVNGETNPSAFRIVKHVSNGTPTTLATSGPQGFGPIANSTTYTMRLEVIGDRLFGYIDGKLIVIARDSTFTTGQPGFQIIYGGSTISFSAGQVEASTTGLNASRTLSCATATYTEDLKAANLKVARNLTAKVFADEQLFSDDFTGVAGLLGSNYTQQGDSNVRLDGLGNAHSIATGRTLAWPNTVVFSNDQYAEITITAIETGGNNSGVGLRIQTGVSPTVEQGYVFRTGNSGAAYTFAQYNTSSTNVNIVTTTVIPQVGDRIRAVIVGSSQYFYVNNQLIAVGSSTAWSTGVPAIYGNGTVWKSDNFVAGNYGGLHLAGTYTTVKSGRVLSCSTASYTLTLNDAILTKTAGRTLIADAVSFTVAPTATGLIYARRLAIEVKTLTIATSTLNLLVSKKLVATLQTYAIGSTQVTFLRGLRISVTAQAFTLTGPPNNNLLRGRKVIADIRSYSLAPVPINLLYGRLVTATKQTYTLSMTPANILRGRKVLADIRTYSLVRNDANILRKAVLGATQQTYNIAGVQVALIKIGARVLIASPTALTLGTTEVTLARSRILSLTVYAGIITRNPANILYGRKVVADIRTYTLSSSVTNLAKGRILGLTVYTAVLARNPANILRNRTVIADIRTYTLSPSVTNLNRGRLLGVTVYAATLTRNPANILQNRVVIADIRAFTYTRLDANILKGRRLTLDKQSYNFTFNQLLFGRGGFIKVWTGSAWTPKPLKTWNGTAWVSKPLKVWTGSIWRTY